MIKYDLEYVDKLRIHELRDFARKLGVSSPTTLKKDELISKVTQIILSNENMEIVSGVGSVGNTNEMDFVKILTSNSLNIIDEILATRIDSAKLSKANVSSPVDDINNPEESSSGADYKIAQSYAEYEDSNSFFVQGYLDIHQEGYGIIRYNGFVPSQNDSCVPTSIMRKYKLKKGQFVSGKAKIVIEGKPKVVYDITEIEHTSVKKYNHTINYEDVANNGVGASYYLNKFNIDIKKGERHYIANIALDDALAMGLELVEENITCVKFVNIKAKPEDNQPSIGKLSVVHVPFNKTATEALSTIELVVDRLKREFEAGKENILIIYNFSELIRLVNAACEGSIEFAKINLQAINKINNMLYVSKDTGKESCISVICMDRNGAPKDIKTVLELELLPIFSKSHNSVKTK